MEQRIREILDGHINGLVDYGHGKMRLLVCDRDDFLKAIMEAIEEDKQPKRPQRPPPDRNVPLMPSRGRYTGSTGKGR